MRILVIGSGAREHALLNTLHRDPDHHVLHCAPGNAGTAHVATNHDVDPVDNAAVVALARAVEAELVIIGSEVPLVLGVADALRDAGIVCFGPSAAAARIEGSKAFAKEVMAAAGVRTAHSEVVDNPAHLDAALDRFGPHWVVKDDRIAAGKGVVVTDDRATARQHAASLLDDGHPVLLETYLDGPEISLFCLVDGETVVPLVPAQDFKRVGDDDIGPNTGGMGAYAPLPWLPEGAVQQLVTASVAPVASELLRRGTPFTGLLYAGFAWGTDGPAVVEFNCRFGDPETQAVLAMLRSPLGELLHATATGSLAEVPAPEWEPGAAVVVVLAAAHYPGKPRLDDVVTGAEGVLHAGTAVREDGAVVSAGGRVISAVGTGADLTSARDDAYARLASVKLLGGHFRTDIARAAVDGKVALP